MTTTTHANMSKTPKPTSHSVQPEVGGFKSFIANAAPSLDISSFRNHRPLLHLITQYIFPEPKEWIGEWTGLHGYDVIYDAVTDARTSLQHDEVTLVIQYCKKSDVFGLAELEAVAGNGNREKGMEELRQYLGNYNAEKSFPLEIDSMMQTSLSQYFSPEALRFPKNIRMITEIYSLYWCPKKMSANIIEQIAKHSIVAEQITQGIYLGFNRDLSDLEVFQQYGNLATVFDCWLLFPNNVFWRNKPIKEQEALIPLGFQLPSFSEATFCIFMKYCCTRTRIMSDDEETVFEGTQIASQDEEGEEEEIDDDSDNLPAEEGSVYSRSMFYTSSSIVNRCPTFTRCQEQIDGNKLAVGGFDRDGLSAVANWIDADCFGIAILRRLTV